MAQTKLKTFDKRKLSVFELIVMVLLVAYCAAVVALLVWGFMACFPTGLSGGQRRNNRWRNVRGRCLKI